MKNKFLKTELFDGVEIYTIDGIEYMRHKLSNGFLSLMDIEEFASSVIDFRGKGIVRDEIFDYKKLKTIDGDFKLSVTVKYKVK